MSTKQSLSAEEQLAKSGLTTQQAFNFIVANIEQPEIILFAAFNTGVNVNMLNEITNVPHEVICEYFDNAGFDCTELNDTSLLLNSDADAIENFVGLNERSGILSNENLSKRIEVNVSQEMLHFFWGPVNPTQPIDGVYDCEELGLGAENCVVVPATEESLQSLFYGTLINVMLYLDESELMDINEFPDDGAAENFQALLFGALDDQPESNPWSDDKLSDFVTDKATQIIPASLIGDVGLVGILDALLLPEFWG